MFLLVYFCMPKIWWTDFRCLFNIIFVDDFFSQILHLKVFMKADLWNNFWPLTFLKIFIFKDLVKILSCVFILLDACFLECFFNINFDMKVSLQMSHLFENSPVKVPWHFTECFFSSLGFKNPALHFEHSHKFFLWRWLKWIWHTNKIIFEKNFRKLKLKLIETWTVKLIQYVKLVIIYLRKR